MWGFGDSLPQAGKLAVCFVLAKMLVKLLPMTSWDLDLIGTEAEVLGECVEKQARVLEYAGDFLRPPVVLRRKRKASQLGAILKLYY